MNLLRSTHRAAVVCLALWCAFGPSASPAPARVTRIVLDEKQSPAYGGKSFGAAGPYERIAGRAFGEIDPRDPHNTIITDLDAATLVREAETSDVLHGEDKE